MRKLAIVMAMLALAACRPAPAGRAAREPKAATNAPASAQLTPMTVRGTEPFWAAEIAGQTLTLTRPEQAQRTLAMGEPTFGVETGAAIATTSIPLSGGGRLVLRGATCSDGMSDLTYPMAAELTLEGQTLRGCAFYREAPPQPQR